MKKQLLKTKALMLLVILTAFSGVGKGQSYTCSVTNDIALSTTEYQFDITFTNTSSSTIQICSVAPIININAGIFPSGATVTISKEFSDLVPANQVPADGTKIKYLASNQTVQLQAAANPGAGSGTYVPAGNTIVLYRLKATSSLPFTANSKAGLSWKLTGTNPITKINFYVGSTATNVTSQGTFNTTGLTNPSLNVPAGPTAPTAANVDVNNFCSNASGNITLTATGGSGTTLAWYSASCGGTPVGTGTPLTIAKPTSNTTYYARWEDGTNYSTCASVDVNVTAAPAQPVVTVNNTCGNSAFTITNGEVGATFDWTPAVADLNNVAAGTYTVTQTVGTCTSVASADVVAAPLAVPVQPVVTVNNTCGNSAFTITNGEVGATFDWTPAVADLNNVAAGTYTVTQTVGTCTSIASADVVAAPLAVPAQPVVTVNNTCGNSAFTITNGEAGASFDWTPAVANLSNVAAGTYTVTQTVGTCTSVASADVVAAPLAVPAQPVVTVNNTCGNSAFTITNGEAGASFDWTPAVADLNNVAAGTYTVTQTVGTCTSVASADVVAAPVTPVTPSVVIAADQTSVTAGTTVTFTPTPTNGGTPSYAYYVNGNLATTLSGAYSFAPANNDEVYVIMTSDLSCVTSATATSNTVTMTVTPAGPITSTFTGTGNWTDVARWNNGIPGAIDNAVISGNLTITGAATVASLTVENGASILGNDLLTVTGLTQAKRTITPNAWHLMSSSANGSKANSFYNNNLPPVYLQMFNNNGTWAGITDGNYVLTNGKGYSTWADNGIATVTFKGNLNYGPVSVPVLMNTGLYGGWGFNLLGNPYPSAIDLDVLYSINTQSASFYTWNQANGQYSTYNAQTQIGQLGATNIIPANQGFFVNVAAAGNYTFMDAYRTHSATPLAKSTPANILRLNVQGNNLGDEAVITFNSNATNNYDFKFDSRKLMGSGNAPQMYTVVNGEKLSINSLSELIPNTSVSVPMNLEVGADGNYTITASELNSFTVNTTVYLIDSKTNQTINMSQNPVYNFTANTGDNANRFTVLFAATSGINSNNADNLVIFSHNNDVFVTNKGNETIREIQIMNALGQQIVKTGTESRISLNVETGYYFVKVITSGKTYTQKVFIH